MYPIHVQSLSLSHSLDIHLRVQSFSSFFLCYGVIVYFGSHWMVYIVALGDSNFFSIGLPSLIFLLLLPFVYLHFNLLLWNLLFSVLGQTSHRWNIVVPICTILLMTCYSGLIYLGSLGGGITACFCGAFSVLVLSSILIRAGIVDFIPIWGNWP